MREVTVPVELEIQAAAGKARAMYFASPTPTTAGIVVFMDVFGLRPALYGTCQRLAAMGYNVLLPDLYYRLGPYGPFRSDEALANPEVMAEVRSLRDRSPITLAAEDAPYFLDAIAAQGATGKIGYAGYCMGAGRSLRAANAAPERVAAVATLHGGRLAIDDPDSPHHHLANIKARLYIGSAGVDVSFPPEQSAIFLQALRSQEIDHVFENYVGCEHGWTLSDNPIFHPAGSERHFKRLEVLFGETLREGA